MFLQHLGQPLRARGQEKVLQVHEVLNGARSSKSRMKCPAVIVEGNSELFWLHNSLGLAIFCWACSADLHALASTSSRREDIKRDMERSCGLSCFTSLLLYHMDAIVYSFPSTLEGSSRLRGSCCCILTSLLLCLLYCYGKSAVCRACFV